MLRQKITGRDDRNCRHAKRQFERKRSEQLSERQGNSRARRSRHKRRLTNARRKVNRGRADRTRNHQARQHRYAKTYAALGEEYAQLLNRTAYALLRRIIADAESRADFPQIVLLEKPQHNRFAVGRVKCINCFVQHRRELLGRYAAQFGQLPLAGTVGGIGRRRQIPY